MFSFGISRTYSIMLSSVCLAFIVRMSAALDDFDIDTDDHINLLQVQAKKHNRTSTHLPLNHHMVFDKCATFGGAPDIIGAGTFQPQAEDIKFDYCRCWGDPHCNALPFDVEQTTVGGRGNAHYQYDGPGASRYAKAADGSWEIQIFQCGNKNHRSFHPSGQVGVAVKVGGTVVEAGTANKNAAQCRVNGELKPPGYEVHLPTGFHFKCPEAKTACARCSSRSTANGLFCAVKDGQFVATTNHWEWGSQINQVLAVSKTADVQQANTICYDPSSKDGLQGPKGGKQMSTTAIVSAEEVLFSQAMIDYMTSAPLCLVQDPPQSGVPAGESADPEQLCTERAPDAWQHAQDVCSSLREKHPAFYDDCLVDECLRGDDSDRL
jgi:hypothetical protein